MEPLPPRWPSSMYFLALSQAAPPLVMYSAMKRPVTIAPTSMPPSAFGPRIRPTRIGAATGMRPGRIISPGAADRQDGQRAEQERQDAAQEQAHDHVRVAEVEAQVLAVLRQLLRVRGE